MVVLLHSTNRSKTGDIDQEHLVRLSVDCMTCIFCFCFEKLCNRSLENNFTKIITALIEPEVPNIQFF